jgi:hypothetical protein
MSRRFEGDVFAASAEVRQEAFVRQEHVHGFTGAR